MGIGVPRAGTTWLYQLMASHPEIYVPEQRKEVHFFDRYYDRGYQWYSQFFPLPQEQNSQYKAIGEITPHYLYCDKCPERIAQLSSVNKLILLLRDPVSRAYSHYLFRVRVDNYSESFEDFIDFVPEAIEWGFYSKGLENYLRYFSKNQFLVLIYEHIFDDLDFTQNKLAAFLDINSNFFSPSVVNAKVNKSYQPKLKRTYALATKVANNLRERDLYWVINLGKKLGGVKLFGEKKVGFAPMRSDTKAYLKNLYAKEIPKLEQLLGINLDCWK